MDKKVSDFLERAKVSAELFANRSSAIAAQAADSAGKTAATMMETTKLNLQIFDLNTEVEILYKEIGKIVYRVHIGAEADQEDMQIKLGLIDEKLDKIASLRARLREVKADVVCPNCGKNCADGDQFCSNCGAQL